MKPTTENFVRLIKTRIKTDELVNEELITQDIIKQYPEFVGFEKKILGIAAKLLAENEVEQDQESEPILTVENILMKMDEKQSTLIGLSGKLDDETFFHTVFVESEGKFIPLVVTSNAEIIKVECDEGEDEEVFYFIYKDNRFQYKQELFFDLRWGINTVNNDFIKMVSEHEVVDKKIYDDVRKKIHEYWDTDEKFEYDVDVSLSIQTYIQNLLKGVIYNLLAGKQDTGKSTKLRAQALLHYNGYYGAKGTLPFSVRMIHFLQISLCQDEIDKIKNKEDISNLVGVFNTGQSSGGRYGLVNTNKKRLKDQITMLDTYSGKNFSANWIHMFDPTFISRCHITMCVRNSRPVKDIRTLSKEEIESFQQLRNYQMLYCLFNWKDILADIKSVEGELQEEKRFGRATDTDAIILGIIKHFKGEHYKQVKTFLLEKENLFEEKNTDLEFSVMKFILSKFDDGSKPPYIDIYNKEILDFVIHDLGISEESKYKPTSTSLGRLIVGSLKLVVKNEDRPRKAGEGYRGYRIHQGRIADVIIRNGWIETLQEYIPDYMQVLMSHVPQESQESQKNLGEEF